MGHRRPYAFFVYSVYSKQIRNLRDNLIITVVSSVKFVAHPSAPAENLEIRFLAARKVVDVEGLVSVEPAG